MKYELRLIILTLSVLSLTTATSGQSAKIEGHVSDDRDRRVPRVRVVVTPGGQAGTTDSKGHFIISLPDNIQPGQAAQIRIERAKWVIFNPMFGNCATQNKERNFEPLRVVIVPRGSPLALSPKRITEVVAQWATERSKQTQEITRLHREVNDYSRELDEYAFLREYAEEYGFTLDRFVAAANQWAHIKDADDKEEMALKEYWQKNYDSAAQLARQAARAADEELERVNQQKTETSRKVIRRYILEGSARYAEFKFREALDAYSIIEQRFETRKIYKEDFTREWAEVKLLLGNTKGELGIRVEGAERPRLLAESLAAYRQAETFYTREALPRNWATTQNNLGVTLRELGNLAEGAESVRYLNEAIAAYRAALEVRTREQLPQYWAATQNNLGNVLTRLGEQAEGAESIKYLKEAAAALRAAQEIYTRAQSPQDWARVQNNQCVVLLILGAKVEGADSVRYRNEATAACRAALEVFTRAQFPQQWGLAQKALALAYFDLEDWEGASEAYANVLQVHPDDKKAHRRASRLYHEVLFKFDQAFALHQRWLARHKDDVPAQEKFAEAYLTTARFPECVQQITALLARPEVPADSRTALRAIEIASLLALDNNEQVPAKLDALIAEVSRQPAAFKVEWSFNGTKYFIGHYEKLMPHRAWLGQLFDALADKDRDAILEALKEVRAKFKE